MFNFTFLQTMVAGFRYYSFDAYDFMPGEWMYMNQMDSISHFQMTMLDSYNTTEGINITTYQASVYNTLINITISSKTHLKIKYGETYPEFEIDITQKPSEVAIYDGYLPNDIYSMMTFYSRSSFEISLVFPQDKQTIHTYGFFKQPSYRMDSSDYLIIIGIALLLTFLFKNFIGNAL